MKLAKNFSKAGSFILGLISTLLFMAESVLQTLPPEVLGEYGAPVAAIVSALITIERVRKQKSVSGDD